MTYAYDPAGQLVRETSPHGIVRSYTYGNANADAFGTDLRRQTLHVNTAPNVTLSLARIDEIEQCLAEVEDCAAVDEASVDAALADLVTPGSAVNPAVGSGVAGEVARWLELRNGRGWAAGQAVALGSCIDPGEWGGQRYKATVPGTSGSAQPVWSNATVTDGSVEWTPDACTPILVLSSFEYDTSSPSKHQLVKTLGQYADAASDDACHAYDSRGNQTYRGACATGAANQAADVLDRATEVRDDAGALVTLSWYRDEQLLKTFTRGSTCHKLQYDGSGQLVRMQALSGGCTGTVAWTSEYVHDSQGLSAFRTAGTWYYLDRNQRGDIAAIRNSSGALQVTIHYTAYGHQRVTYQTGADTTLADKLALTYNGRDGVVNLGGGLYWMGARIYSATQARFISADSVEATAGTTASTYNYADNDPINLSDPDGHWAVGWMRKTFRNTARRGGRAAGNAYFGAGASLGLRNRHVRRASRYSPMLRPIVSMFNAGYSRFRPTTRSRSYRLGRLAPYAMGGAGVARGIGIAGVRRAVGYYNRTRIGRVHTYYRKTVPRWYRAYRGFRGSCYRGGLTHRASGSGSFAEGCAYGMAGRVARVRLARRLLR